MAEITGHIDSCFNISAPWGEELLLVEGWLLDLKHETKKLRLNVADARGDEIILTERPDVASLVATIPHAKTSGFVAIIPRMQVLPVTIELATGETLDTQIPLENSLKAASHDSLFAGFTSIRTKKIFNELSEHLLERFLSSNKKISLGHKKAYRASVIIPVYNKAHYTLLALWSLATQSEQTFEIIVIDNASTDKTSTLLERFSHVQIIRNDTNAHYITACNQGAHRAQGEYLIFLNNDCFLEHTAIQNTLDHFSNPNVGIVGGLLINPPGLVQEIGSRILSDGSTIGIGRHSNPKDAGEMATVDYCSGAFLATPRMLFINSGGFSDAFSPAYGEDADYALTIQEKGLQVLCEPTARILHVEHGSSDRLDAVTPLIERSKKILRDRHPAFFTTTLSPNNPNVQKRVLVIDDLLPDKKAGQGLPRAALLLDELLKLNLQITFIAVNEVDRHKRSIPGYETVQFITNIARTQLPDFLDRWGGIFQGIIVSRPPNMEILARLGAKIPPPILYDAESVFALRDIAKHELIRSTRLSPLEIQTIVHEETKIAQKADLVLTVSDLEAQHFQTAGISKVSVLSYGVDTVPDASAQERDTLLTVGPIIAGDSPNYDGAQWFLHEVYPLLQKIDPNRTPYHLVGNMLPSLREYFNGLPVTIHGAVSDLLPYYARARVFIAPTRFAAGIPLKVVEASAHGIPSVVTPLLAKQLGWKENEEVLVGHSAKDFADKISLLLLDDRLWSKLSANVLTRVRSQFSRLQFEASVLNALKALKILK